MTDQPGRELRFDAAVSGALSELAQGQRLVLRWSDVGAAYPGSGPQSPPAALLPHAFRIENIPRLGPIEVYRRAIQSELETARFLTPRSALRTIVASGGEVSESRFWELIELLDQQLTRSAARRLVSELRKLDEDEVAAFQVALERRVAALDHPSLAVWSGRGNRRAINDDASQYRRASVVALGKEAFGQATRDPGSIRTFASQGELLLTAAIRALSSEAETVAIDTGVDLQTGSNRRWWSQEPIEALAPSDRLRAFQEAIDRHLAIEGITPEPGDPWYDASRPHDWLVALYLVEAEGRTAERLTCLAVPRRVDSQPSGGSGRNIPDDAAQQVARLASITGERLVSSPEYQFSDRPWNLGVVCSLDVALPHTA